MSTLSIGSGITAVFDEAQRETTYSVPTVSDDTPGAKCCTYAWTLSIAKPTGQVDPAFGVDPGCNNHGLSGGTDPVFTWEHGNKGDPVRDDGCDHSVYGRYGHQGLITVDVSDTAGWSCTATYKGTLSNADAPADAASTPTCSGPAAAPPPAQPCKCIRLTTRILPSSLNVDVLRGITGIDVAEIKFSLHWTLACTGGATDDCIGYIGPVPGAVKDAEGTVRHEVVSTASVSCDGRCGQVREGVSRFALTIPYITRVDLAKLGQLPIEIHRRCFKTKKVFADRYWIAFDKSGRIDRAKSKLR